MSAPVRGWADGGVVAMGEIQAISRGWLGQAGALAYMRLPY